MSKDLPAENRRRLAERWVEYLEEGSGLLIEQNPGNFAFFHLSFLEYLAARGWERKAGAASLPGATADRLGEAAWEEVCLLTVGIHAEDGPFLDTLFDAVTGSEHSDRWVFLLRALREEAIFKPEQRERILEEAGKEAVEQGRWHGHSVLNDVMRFSVRNGEPVRAWLEEALRWRTGEELKVAAALRLWQEETIGSLDSRADQSEAARSLLEFWPGSKIGDWAAERIQPTEALVWALAESRDELLHLRGIAALQQDTALPAALSLALASRSQQLGCNIKQAHEVLARLGRPEGHGMFEALQVRPGEILLPTEPLLPVKPMAKRETRSPFARGLARDLTRGFGREAVLGEMVSYAIAFHPDVAHDVTHNFARDVLHHIPHFPRDFASQFAHAFDRLSE